MTTPVVWMVGCVLQGAVVGSAPPPGVVTTTVGGTGVFVAGIGVFVAAMGVFVTDAGVGVGFVFLVAVGGMNTGVGEVGPGVGVREGMVICRADATAFVLLTWPA